MRSGCVKTNMDTNESCAHRKRFTPSGRTWVQQDPWPKLQDKTTATSTGQFDRKKKRKKKQEKHILLSVAQYARCGANNRLVTFKVKESIDSYRQTLCGQRTLVPGTSDARKADHNCSMPWSWYSEQCAVSGVGEDLEHAISLFHPEVLSRSIADDFFCSMTRMTKYLWSLTMESVASIGGRSVWFHPISRAANINWTNARLHTD